MTVINRLAEWAAETPAKWSDVALERAEHGIEDVFACLVAGASDEAAARVRSAIAPWGEGTSSVVGQRKSAAPPWAALANGTAAHALDYDDILRPAVTHATAVLFPALLALAEEIDASGAALLDAYVVGLEMQAAVGRGVNRSHYDAGWHATSTIGCIGAAAACGRLLGLDTARMGHAMSLSVSMASGPKVQFGTMAKPFHAGMAAQHAVMAATLARAGLEARDTALEGGLGFLPLYGGPDPLGWDSVLPRLGEPLAIEKPGLCFKRHPCCGSTHLILDCIIDLQREHGFTAEDVAGVDTLIGTVNKRNLMYDNPQNEMQARFSLQYCVAVALLNARLTLADFTPAAVTRPAVCRLLKLTSIRTHDPAEEPADADTRLPHSVEITLNNGQRLSASREHPRGSMFDPFDDSDRAQKFSDCCEGILAPASLTAARGQLAKLRDLDSLRTLAAHLRFDAIADHGERFLQNRTKAAMGD
ncbi:MAG: MmgE/PrpD family protein [Acidiferrobacterales bacterium]